MLSHDEGSDTSELVNQIFRGEVAAVHNYGAFLKIPGHKSQGLVHKSQISTANVPDATEVLEKGDTVWFKVIKVLEDKKISLSMKVVDQGTGRDLDPNGVQIHLDEQQKKDRNFKGEANAIKLDAVLNTVCSKCKVKGHLSKDCFKTSDKVYELIPEPEPERKIFGSELDRQKRIADCGIVENLRKKKESKKKKKRSRSSSSSSTDEQEKIKKKHKHSKKSDRKSSDSDGSVKRKKLKKKSHKKHKKLKA